MAISLQKGGNINLSKEAPSLTQLHIGLGWNVRVTDGADFDLDGSAFLLDASGKVRSDADFIFYNQSTSDNGAVMHKGDNRTGAGDGDDEVIEVNLNQVPPSVDKIALAVILVKFPMLMCVVSMAKAMWKLRVLIYRKMLRWKLP